MLVRLSCSIFPVRGTHPIFMTIAVGCNVRDLALFACFWTLVSQRLHETNVLWGVFSQQPDTTKKCQVECDFLEKTTTEYSRERPAFEHTLYCRMQTVECGILVF